MTTSASIHTLADLLERLGGVSPARVRFDPLPGTATEADVLEVERRESRLCELVDGVLVEKAVGYRESLLAGALLALLRAFVVPRNLGLVSGADGMILLFPGLVRIPDVAFVAWDRLPERRGPDSPLPHLVPNLAVEVLSEGNTAAEMERKLGEYFEAGVALVWLVDPRARTVSVHTALERFTRLGAGGTLDGGPVLPSFSLPLRDLFAELDRQG
jgi:Uma2 family endonuclease